MTGPYLVVVSARDEDRLREHCANLADALSARRPRPEAVSYHLQARREAMSERAAVIADDLDGIVACLTELANGRTLGGTWWGSAVRTRQTDGEALDRALATRDLGVLAELWTAGGDIPWDRLYDRPPPHVDLPGYPFARERHWLPPRPAGVPAHPFLSERTGETAFSVEFTGTEFFLDDHRVDGEPIFPAVGYLEMVHAAVAELGGRAVRLRNNVWTSAIRVPAAKRVNLDLTRTATGYDYEVHSTAPDGGREVHGHGKVDTAGFSLDAETVDLDAIRARCGEPLPADGFYPQVHARGLQLGPCYQGIRELCFGDGEALVEIRLPAALSGDHAHFHLHPVLLDSALQGSLGLINRREPAATLHLPFSIGALHVGDALPAHFFAHVAVTTWTPAAKKITVRVADPTGRVVLAVHDLWLRRWHTEPAAPGAYFRPQWTRQDITASTSDDQTLLFAPTTSAGAAFAAAANGRTMVAVPDGTGPNAHPVDPTDPKAFADLLDSCDSLRDIVFAWPAAGFPGTDPDTHHRDGIVPLVHLLRAALARTRGSLRVLVAHPTDENGVHPAYEAVAGLLRTASREHPRLAHRVVGLPTTDVERFAAGDSAVATTLLAELAGDWTRGDTVRHGAEGREVRGWRHATPQAPWTPATDGGYLITGGAGGLGLLVATDLVTRYGARVVLAGRSDADSRVESAIADLRAGGGEAHYVRADVARAEDTAAAVTEVRSRFGSISGVVHAAGVQRDAYLTTLDVADLAAVLAPKVHGVRNLDAATADDDLRDFVLFSSVAGALGTVGQAAYAYANSFLDAFAEWRDGLTAQGIRSGRTHALGWPLWRSGRMGVDAEVETALAATFGLRPLETETGLAAMAVMLGGPAGQTLFVPGDGAKVADQLGITERPGAEVTTAEPVREPTRGAQVGDHTAAATALVVAEVAEIVRLDPARVRVTAEIGDYGFDSLSFTRLANRLNTVLGVDVTPALFFEHTTVESVVGHLVETFPAELRDRLGATLPAVVDAVPASDRPAAPALVAVRHEPVPAREPIAIVGMHGMLPRSDDLAEFWANLTAGHDLVTEIPRDRWDWRDNYSPTLDGPGKTNSKWGGFLRAVDEFDHRFFGISPREAALMDPQQRIFLQTAYKAIEEAGYRPADLATGRTGLFVGVATHDYYELLREAGVPVEAYTTTGMFHAILANRVSYLLNLKGPSFPIDTACSSSLVAVRSAVEAIWSGSCEMAIAGGVNLLIAPMIYISFARAGMLSPTGRCRTFDEAADGYVRGEGAGAVLLKPLSAAQRDGDHVHAIIRGSAVNHGGRVNTLTTPNPNAQSDLIVQAFRESDVDPGTVGYMEMHGTGTALGDPIEVNGLKKAWRTLGAGQRTGTTTVVGSVKTNIGHLEAAAGMAGIFKVVLSMKHGQIPGNLHLNQLNPHIKLDGGVFEIADTTRPWAAQTGADGERLPRRGGVSSFGFGGVNGHVLLEEYLDDTQADADSPGDPHVFVLSARSAERLRHYAADLADALTTQADDRADVLDALRALAADLLNVRAGDVGADEVLRDLGFEGPLVAALRARAQDEIGVRADELLPGRSLRQIAEHAAPSFPRLPLRDVAFTLQVGRTIMDSRLAVVACSAAGLVAALRAFAETGEPGPAGYHADARRPPVSDEFDPNAADSRQLAEYWAGGGEVDWLARYAGTRPRRLSLPTYPFARSTHWIPAGSAPAATVSGATPDEVVRRIGPTDRLVAEHRVHGDPVLPGAGQLELVAGALAERGIVTGGLREIVWLSPVTVPDDGYELRIRLVQTSDRIEFALRGERDGETITHSRGQWVRSAPSHDAAPPLHLASVLALCPDVLQHDEVYRRFDRIGLGYGPFFRGIDEVRAGQDVAVARFSTTEDASRLRPAVLDVALQTLTAAGFARSDRDDATRLPFSLGRLDLVRPIPVSGHVVLRQSDSGADLTVLDGSGAVCAVLGDVVVRTMTDPLAGMVFTPTWTQAPVSGAAGPGSADGCLIIAPQRCFGLEDAIAARYTPERVHRVRIGVRTRRLGERLWEVAEDDENGITACLAALGLVRDVWFLGGVLDRSADQPSTAGKPSGAVVMLFRLVRALGARDITGPPPALRVVVNDVHDVDGRRITNSAGGALIGFTSTLAKEMPGGIVSCVDIGVPVTGRPDAAELAAVVSALLAEHGDAATEVCLVDGRRHVRRLAPAALPARLPSPFRRGGVYLLVGGAGGIGLVLASHLASSVSARIVLVGRGAATDETRAALAELAALGGEACYLRADVADPDAMRHVLDETKRRFGALNGVVHAGMVLRDGIIERLAEPDLVAVLRPKVEGSHVLAELVAREPLDFLLFMSSIQSFTGSAGQSNYAAASTGQDVAARLWAHRLDYPVRVVNWGYWGTVGRVATEQYRQGMTARGLHSITPAEGIAAIERILAGDESQVVVVKAAARALPELGADAGKPPPAHLARPVDLGADFPAVRREVDAAIAVSVLRVLRELSLWGRVGQAHARHALLATAGIAPRHSRLVDGLVHLMIRRGFLIESESGLIATERRSDERLADLRARHPELRARLTLVEACLDALPRVLTGALAATEVLFPAGSTDLVAPIYQGDRLTDYCNDLVAKQVGTKAGLLAARGETVEVLEIGGGTGATTRAVLRELAAVAGRVRYTFTDVSPRFLRQAEQVLRAESVELRFDQLDITRTAIGQGFPSAAHHIVVAANVLHATPDLDATLRNAHALLVPGGDLVMTEVTEVEAFHMITFGLLDGWWNFTDPLRRLADSPLLDTAMWRARLSRSGFAEVSVHGTARQGGPPPQRVIVGIAAGALRPVVAAPPSPAAVPAPLPALKAVAPMNFSALTDRLVRLLCEITADCLNMPGSEVDPTATLSAYGVDSIVGVELITKVNAALGVVVRTIVIFDYPTIAELARYLADKHPDAATAWAGNPDGPDSVEPASAVPARPGAEPRANESATTWAVAPPVVASPPAEPSWAPPTVPAASANGSRAVRFVRPGDPSGLVLADHVPGAPGPGEVEVLVRAFPINFSDFLLSKGLYPLMPEFPFTPGVEVSGVVGRVGPGVTRVVPGDEVIALTRPEMGGQASAVVTDETFVVRKPANVTHEQACGFPVAFLAMYLAFERARPEAGESVLIPAATGTNGLLAVQLAQLAGAEVIATAGGGHKIDHLASLGVADAIDHSQVDFADEVLRRTGGRGVDVVINALGDGALQKGLNVLAPDGRYIEIAVFGLQSSGGVDLSRLMDNQSFHSFNTKKFFLRHPDRRVRYLDIMVAHLESGAVRPAVAQVFAFDQVAEAYAAKRDRGVIGRIVVSVPEPVPVSAPAPARTADRSAPNHSTDIAVIGMSARFPGADDVEQLWDNLAGGVDSVREVPADRWSSERFFDPDQSRLDTTYCKWGGFLDDVDRFDAAFFSISGKEAAHTDPQQRIFMEETWKALQDAGRPTQALNGTRCGVFVGVGPSEYLTRMNKADATRHAQVFWGNEASILAARISYFLNLRGPSVAVNTACSSSLVAVHLACQSLMSGETDVAIAGGVFLTLAPDYLVVASNGTMLSSHGRCRTFDDSADGFAPGEGAGALVLKPLDRALADGDRIHGVIKGTATNQDGRTNGITAPSGGAQAEVELAAYARAGISPDTIGYVEAHGTGTRLGDPIEVDALTTAFREHTDKVGFCPIGSIKTNIGHTAAAAGIAGIVKVLLAFRHGQIPPSLHYRTPNRHIDFESSPFFVNTELRDWRPAPDSPRRAAVSSFGFSGTNAHAVLEEPPAHQFAPVGPAGPLAVPVSARTVTALRAGTARLVRWLAGPGATASLAEIAHTSQIRRDHFDLRAVYVVADRDELLARLLAGDEGRTAEDSGPQGVLARRYLAGEQVDWATAWSGPPMPPVSLPGYAFDRTRHWYTEHDTVYADGAERLVQVIPAAGTGHPVPMVRATFTGADRYLRDHVVAGEPVLPAVLHLEAVAQAARSLGLPCDQFSDVVWLRPLVVADDRPAEVDVRIASDGKFSILSADGADTVHVQGGIGHRDASAPVPFDLTAAEIDCPHAIDSAVPYQRMADAGLRHGPSLVVLTDVHTGEGRATATVRLPDGAPGPDAAILHPALFDGALHLLAAFGMDSGRGVALPFAVERIVRWAPLRSPSRVVAVARNSAVPAFDIRVHDENGTVLLELFNLTIKAIGGAYTSSAELLRALLRQVRAGGIHVEQANAALEAILGD